MNWKRNLKGLCEKFKMCNLCDAYTQEYRFVCESEHSFCFICKEPLKLGHVLIVPKKCVSQKEINKLTPDESYDLNCLVQTMEDVLGKLSGGNVMTFKNSGNGSTECHFHFHLLPSKGNLRDLISGFENIPNRELKSNDEMMDMRDLIREKFTE